MAFSEGFRANQKRSNDRLPYSLSPFLSHPFLPTVSENERETTVLHGTNIEGAGIRSHSLSNQRTYPDWDFAAYVVVNGVLHWRKTVPKSPHMPE